MSEVAARAGASLKSVSRVVNGEPHVSPELDARVRRAIVELGYRPDRRARGLAADSNDGRLIGFVQVDAANPWFAAVYRGLEDAALKQDGIVIAGSTDADPEREAALIETLMEFRVDGLVVAAAEGSDDFLRREIARGTQIVCVDRPLSDVNCDLVVCDNREGTVAAVTHLLEIGHQRIAFVGGNQAVWTARQRFQGYRDALRDAGLTPSPELEVVNVDHADDAQEAVRRLFSLTDDPPTAIFAAQDRITIGAVSALHAAGRQHDVALFGFDEIQFSEVLSPSISVVAQHPYEMGHRAGELLHDRLADRVSSRPARAVVPSSIIHRQSGNIRPASDGFGSG